MAGNTNSAVALVDAFLKKANYQRRYGRPCETCRLPNAAAINAAILRFHELRESGEQAMPWPNFVQDCLKAAPLNYPMATPTALRHLWSCLGKKPV